MSYIITFTGKKIDPVEPEESLIDIEDIAHALSLICRANGHVKYFYSVAQHSVNCCKEAMLRGCSKRIQLACLLHDASEAYLSDVTRPVKSMLTKYLLAEDALQDMIWGRYMKTAPTEAEKAIIFEIDDDILSYEFSCLMPERLNDNDRKVQSRSKCEYEDMQSVKKEFMELASLLEKASAE